MGTVVLADSEAPAPQLLRHRRPALSRPLPMRTLLPLLLFVLAGCQGAVLGNLVVLGVTFGIFMGTLRLGRAEATRSRADASASEAPAVPSARR